MEKLSWWRACMHAYSMSVAVVSIIIYMYVFYAICTMNIMFIYACLSAIEVHCNVVGRYGYGHGFVCTMWNRETEREKEGKNLSNAWKRIRMWDGNVNIGLLVWAAFPWLRLRHMIFLCNLMIFSRNMDGLDDAIQLFYHVVLFPEESLQNHREFRRMITVQRAIMVFNESFFCVIYLWREYEDKNSSWFVHLIQNHLEQSTHSEEM